MRRIAAILVVFAVGATGATLSSHGTAAPTKAVVQLVTAQPLEIEGAGFKRLEVVRVTATADEDRATRLLTVRRSGAFLARFPGMRYDPCSEVLVLRARGTKGSLASVKLLPRECPHGPD